MDNFLKLISFIPILFFSNYAFACSCGAYPSFKYNFESDFTDLVIHGKVIGYVIVTNRVSEVVYSVKNNQKEASYIQVEVQDVLKGTLNKALINLPRGGGLIKCNRLLTNLPIGSEWIFAMKERQVSACGETLLKVEDSKVINSNHIDKYTEKKQGMPLTELYQILGIPNPTFKRDYLR